MLLLLLRVTLVQHKREVGRNWSLRDGADRSSALEREGRSSLSVSVCEWYVVWRKNADGSLYSTGRTCGGGGKQTRPKDASLLLCALSRATPRLGRYHGRYRACTPSTSARTATATKKGRMSPVKSDDKRTMSHCCEVVLFDWVRVDFAGLYQCIYIHEALGLREAFQQYYIHNRKVIRS